MNITEKEIIAHTPLVKSIVRRYKLPYNMVEDAMQEGMLGLMHAAKKFDSSKGFMFNTYARHWVKHYVAQYIERENKYNNNISLVTEYTDNILYGFKEHNEDSGSDPVLNREIADADRAEDIIKEVDNSRLIWKLRKLVHSLGKREKKVVLDRYFKTPSVTYDSIGKQLNITKQRVCQIDKRTISKLKEGMDNV
jgi:RNA polymerase primary sigma factor